MTSHSEVAYTPSKAKRPYKLADGTAVPGVTTVLGVLAKPALIHWAWQLGVNGEDYRKVKDTAADIGSMAHFMVEMHLLGQKAVFPNAKPEDLAKAQSCFSKFMAFWSREGMELVHSELEIVCSVLRVGGKLDIIAKDKEGNLCLIDLKTSKAIYDEYWTQLAAYEGLWMNYNKLTMPFKRKFIVRIGKEDGEDFEVQERSNLQKHFDLFLAARDVYEAQKAIKG